MAMGEETAQSLGIETARIRRILILVVSVMVAACARTVTAPLELPVGVLTAIVGAPYLILLIKKKLA